MLETSYTVDDTIQARLNLSGAFSDTTQKWASRWSMQAAAWRRTSRRNRKSSRLILIIIPTAPEAVPY